MGADREREKKLNETKARTHTQERNGQEQGPEGRVQETERGAALCQVNSPTAGVHMYIVKTDAKKRLAGSAFFVASIHSDFRSPV